MTKFEFIETIESLFQCEPLEEKDVMQLLVDGFYGGLYISFIDANKFDINVDVFDEVYDMHYGFEKSHAVTTLAYYKNVVTELTNEFRTECTPVESEEFESHSGQVYSLVIHCKEFNVEMINRTCSALLRASDGMDTFHSDSYKQSLLEVICNDDDYKENSGFKLDGDKLVHNSGRAIIFTGSIDAILPDVHSEELIEADDVSVGYKYAIVKNTVLDKTAVAESKYIKLFNKISGEYEIADTKYYSNFTHLIYAESENLNIVISTIRISDAAIINEYELLAKQIYDLKSLVPHIPIQTRIGFSHLSDDEFEALCFDLLNREGFRDVKRIGKTNAPDGGVDIFADEEFRGLFRLERRRWVFQCKHSKKSLDRKEVAEIGDLIAEHNAQGYGLFCSNSITPKAIERLENKKEKLDGNLQYFGKPEISMLVEKYPDLVIKYKLLS